MTPMGSCSHSSLICKPQVPMRDPISENKVEGSGEKIADRLDMVVPTFNPITPKAKAGGFL